MSLDEPVGVTSFTPSLLENIVEMMNVMQGPQAIMLMNTFSGCVLLILSNEQPTMHQEEATCAGSTAQGQSIFSAC